MPFSEFVKNVRKKLGLSQEELAHKVGVSFSTLNRWENRKTSPSKLALNQFTAYMDKMPQKRKISIEGAIDKSIRNNKRGNQ